MTPALVFRRSVAALDMDESLDVLEDIWWLLSAEARGHRLLQTGKVAVLVHQDADREAARDSMQANLRWAQRLDSLKAGSGSNYLVGTVGRQLARTGRLREFRQLTEHLRTSSLPLDLRTVLLLEGLLARIESRRR